MKINEISIENVIAIRHFGMNVPRPVLLVAGDNESGKSSIAEAIRMAFLGGREAVRVDTKKEFGALVNVRAKMGGVEIKTDRGRAGITLPGGEQDCAIDFSNAVPEALPFCLDMTRFTASTPEERGVLLFRVMRLSLAPPAIKERLAARKCSQEKIDEIAPVLLSGFVPSSKEAAKRATEARGAWRATTGQTWGSKVGERWRAESPIFTGDDAAALQRNDEDIEKIAAELNSARSRLAVAEHEERKADERRQSISALRNLAGTYAARQEWVVTAEKKLANLEVEHAAALQSGGMTPKIPPKRFSCPHCAGSVMLSIYGESLVAWQDDQARAFDPDAMLRVKKIEGEIIEQTKSLGALRQARDEADRAASEVDRLSADPAETAEDKPRESEIIRETVETLQAQAMSLAANGKDLRDRQAALDAADRKTEDARKYHADVLEWSEIADALSPDGIPGDLLAEALGPINERLRQHACDTEWPQVTIGADLSVRAGPFLYRQLSQSAKWRTNAMITEAIAHLSDLRMFVLDEFDVLSVPARGVALTWLDLLAENDEVDTAIVLGTLKQRPELPDTMKSVWIAGGEIREFVKEA